MPVELNDAFGYINFNIQNNTIKVETRTDVQLPNELQNVKPSKASIAARIAKDFCIFGLFQEGKRCISCYNTSRRASELSKQLNSDDIEQQKKAFKYLNDKF